MKGLARRSYSNPPIHGARIVDKIFSSPDLYALWLEVFIKLKSRTSKLWLIESKI